MLDLLGWGEWGLIGALALILIGPRDLPKILHQVGKWLYQIKKFTATLQDACKAWEEPEEASPRFPPPPASSAPSQDALPLDVPALSSQKRDGPQQKKRRKKPVGRKGLPSQRTSQERRPPKASPPLPQKPRPRPQTLPKAPPS